MFLPNSSFMDQQLVQYEADTLSSMPTAQAPSCQEAANSSLLVRLQTLSPDAQGSDCTFPTLLPVPVSHSFHRLRGRAPGAP